MDKLVIIGANDFQNQLILKAKEKGLETHVFSWQDGSDGETSADYFYPISIIEKDQILKKCQEINPIGVISIASDLASITVNYVAEKLGLIGNGSKSSLISTNKYLMRKAFEKRGDPSPKYYQSDEINEEILNNLKFPLIVKPVDRSGSRGITKVNSKKDLQKAIEVAKDLSFDKKAIIEEFINGDEYSVEYISYEGKHYFLALTKKITTGEPHFIEKGHLQPADVSDNTLESVKRVVEHALSTLDIKYGASHSEVKIDENGSVKIIEIGGRMGGDCIGSDLVKISTGYDFVEMVIDVACNKKPIFERKYLPKKAEVHFIFNNEDLMKLEEIKKENFDQIYRISKIEPIDNHIVCDSSSRYGYYLLQK